MNRLLSSIKYDMLFQFRQGFYFAYGFVTLFYVILLKVIPESIAEAIFPFILFTDISVLGFFFIGAVLLLEKGQNSLDALFVTPLRVSGYLISKVISLSILSTIATVILFVTISGDLSFLPILLILVWANMFLYTLLGIGIASKVKSVNHYFIFGVPVGMILFLPLLTYFNFIDFAPLYLLPTEPTLEMLTGNFSVRSVLILIMWMIISWFVGNSLFVKNVVRKGA